MQSFEQIIHSDKPVLIDFYLPVCAPCEKLAPVLDSVKQSLGNRIRVIKVDVEKNKALAHACKVRLVPTVMLFQKGKKLWQQSGMMSSGELLGTILQKSN